MGRNLLGTDALLADFGGLVLLQIMPDGNSDPDEPDDTRNDPICNLAFGCVAGELQAQASLDESEGEEDTAPPDVEGGPDGSSLFADEDGMMEGAEDGLEEESGDDGETDDRVVFVYLVAFGQRPSSAK